MSASQKRFTFILLIGLALSVCAYGSTPVQAEPDALPFTRMEQGLSAQDIPNETPTPATPFPASATAPGIPGFQTATPSEDGYIYHTILSGDFLITIAQAYGISLEELLAQNSLTSDTILQIGQVLRIKRAENPQVLLSPSATLRPSLTPQPTLTPILNPTATPLPTKGPGLFARVFSGNARLLAIGIIALILLSAVLLVVSSRRIH